VPDEKGTRVARRVRVDAQRTTYNQLDRLVIDTAGDNAEEADNLQCDFRKYLVNVRLGLGNLRSGRKIVPTSNKVSVCEPPVTVTDLYLFGTPFA